MDLTRGDTAESEPGGEFCGEIRAEGAVAGVFVGGHAAGGDEMADAGMDCGFAADKGVSRGGRLGHCWGVGEAEVSG